MPSLFLLALTPVASACVMGWNGGIEPSKIDQFRGYDEVFLAHIESVEILPGNRDDGGRRVAARYRLLERFRGRPPQNGIVLDHHYDDNGCAFGLADRDIGQTFAFFVDVERKAFRKIRWIGVMNSRSIEPGTQESRDFLLQLRSFRSETQ